MSLFGVLEKAIGATEAVVCKTMDGGLLGTVVTETGGVLGKTVSGAENALVAAAGALGPVGAAGQPSSPAATPFSPSQAPNAHTMHPHVSGYYPPQMMPSHYPPQMMSGPQPMMQGHGQYMHQGFPPQQYINMGSPSQMPNPGPYAGSQGWPNTNWGGMQGSPAQPGFPMQGNMGAPRQ
ncbi:uncharacterized protein TrAtP1_009727 [Trichoderma atroviride]|uniref:Uncharacterized protein n=1 Tax=Hypocrea atroviridis (strain ATCC 20476 / IMI 206040) TaxID=452589 RepID=G9NKU5_HYPAI|nr:uncharacterized protein TRIATDRAFT_281372 [Trichoderma atroviride IMI 206040]EHK48517.1 hypothetical protein TRIATDRAFT_281372 [Trichoderma atroviride IMI 206040]UKZ68704.1 hypothetical protein TrAtP1_009727 [Trichoderma atroviride]